MDEVPRTLKYIYKQNRSLHSTRLKNMKPAIDDRVSPLFRRSIDSNGYLMNNKKRNSYKKYMQQENEKMATRILKIMSSPRREVEVQGYSKYHCVKRGFMDIKGKETQRQRSIEKSNIDLGQRICRMKPDVGNIKDWNEHYVRFMNDSKIVRRKKGDYSGIMGGQGSEGSLVRNMSNSCIEEEAGGRDVDGKEKEKDKLIKFGAIKSERLPYFPELESYSLRRKLSVMNNKSKVKRERENAEEAEVGKEETPKEADTARTQQIYTK